MVRLEAVLDTWKQVRRDTAQAVEDFPASELDFSPVAEVMSFREIAAHILHAGEALAGMLLDGHQNFSAPGTRETMQKYRPPLPEQPEAALLASELRQRLEARCEQLRKQPAEFFSGFVTRMDGQQVTRLEFLQFAKEHELAHRAQLFLYLRMKGIVPVTTRRRQAAK